MIGPSARWHLERRKAILRQYPDVAALPRYNPFALIPITLIPLVYMTIAYLSQYLSILNISILAWCIGSRACFAMFKYSHEMSHHLIHPSIKKHLANTLLSYLNVFNLSTSIYLLFSFGHKPHHAGLGENSLAKAKRFLSEKHPDIELLIDRYYFEIPLTTHASPESLNPEWFHHPLRRLLSIGLLYPISSFLKGTILLHLVLIFKYLVNFKNSHRSLYTKRLRLSVFQITLLYFGLSLIYILAGPKGILFLCVSDLAQRGFLWHPISTFVIGSHKTWTSANGVQPTTSLYNPWLSFILMKMNFHVEHHDFPDIPCRYLPKLKALAPAYYNNIHSFKGYTDIFKQYFHAPHWFYAGQTGTKN